MTNKQSQQQFEIGMVGLGVMERNLVPNMADHGFSVAGYDKDETKIEAMRKESAERKICGAVNVPDFVALHRKPRAVMMLVPAGAPVGAELASFSPALLVNVDNATLQTLMNNQAAMAALMSIEGCRSLNEDIETIINKSEAVKKARREANDEDLSEKQKKELTEAEKECKSKRREIQEKLIRFATRVPVFKYLTDYRERCLKDVITQLEPALFKKVTTLTMKDFELLVSLGVFNSGLMNDAVYEFKRYEDASLNYTGITKHSDQDVGLFDTVLSPKDYQASFANVASR